MKQKLIDFYFDLASRASELSDATKLKVGTIIVKDDNIISFSWNGTPPGWKSNICEDEVFENGSLVLKTRPEVIHSEENAILKLAKTGQSAKDSSLFCSVAPCIQCAKMIAASGIKNVYYIDEYKNREGIEFLIECNINVNKR